VGFENGRLLRVTLEAQKAAEVQVNVLHYDIQDASFPSHDNDIQTLADTFRDDVISHQKALYDSSWTILPVVITEERDPQDPTAPRESWTSGTAGAGTNTTGGDRLPHGCCAVATAKSAHIGRRATGRVFIGGSWTEENQGSGNWLSGTLTLMAAYVNAFPKQPDLAEGASLASANLCVYSRTARALDQDPYAFFITSWIVRTPVHYLRRRAGTGA
jgi:hypothetical protein